MSVHTSIKENQWCVCAMVVWCAGRGNNWSVKGQVEISSRIIE